MEYAIEVKDLVKRYKDFVALSHFDLEVKEGEIFGLLDRMGRARRRRSTVSCRCLHTIRAMSGYLVRR